MGMNSPYIVVIGFPHNQKGGGLDAETKRSFDGLLVEYSDHHQKKKISMVYVSGKSKREMQKKNFNAGLFMAGGLVLTSVLQPYNGLSIPDNISKQRVGVILLIHGTRGLPKIFEAQTSTTYLNENNNDNGKVIVKILKDLNLSGCIEKLQLVMCGGAMSSSAKTSVVQGICNAIVDANFSSPPMVVGWDCEVTHNYIGQLVVGDGSGDGKPHRTKVYPSYNDYRPSEHETYQKVTFTNVYLSGPTGYSKARPQNWAEKKSMKSKGRCFLL